MLDWELQLLCLGDYGAVVGLWAQWCEAVGLQDYYVAVDCVLLGGKGLWLCGDKNRKFYVLM